MKIFVFAVLILLNYIPLQSQWVRVTNGITNQTISSLATDGINLFAATGGAGVFISTNFGANWTAVNNGLPSLFPASLLINGYYILAGIEGGYIYKSTNNGATGLLPAMG